MQTLKPDWKLFHNICKKNGIERKDAVSIQNKLWEYNNPTLLSGWEFCNLYYKCERLVPVLVESQLIEFTPKCNYCGASLLELWEANPSSYYECPYCKDDVYFENMDDTFFLKAVEPKESKRENDPIWYRPLKHNYIGWNYLTIYSYFIFPILMVCSLPIVIPFFLFAGLISSLNGLAHLLETTGSKIADLIQSILLPKEFKE